jgi:hypothetical protein
LFFLFYYGWPNKIFADLKGCKERSGDRRVSFSRMTAELSMLPADPPLASDALAIRIIFPLVRGFRILTACRVCQLRWANKKASTEWADAY